MTDQPLTPEAEKLREHIAQAFAPLAPLAQALRDAWPAIEALDQHRVTRAATQDAIGHAFDEEPDRVAAVLRGLNDGRLREIENAAVALSLQVSRHRKAALGNDQTDQPGTRYLDRHGDEWTTGNNGLMHHHSYSQRSIATLRDEYGPLTPVTKQAEADANLRALNAGITDALTRWHDVGGDIAGELAGIREVIDPLIADLTERARLAEQVARQGIADYENLVIEHGETFQRADRTARELHHARIEAAKYRRAAASIEDDAARYMQWLNAARDAAGAPDWPSIPAAITALRGRT